MKAKKVQVPDGMTLVKQESIDAMADNIVLIAQAATAIEKRLTRRALLVLIKEGCSRSIRIDDIGIVLNSIQNLDVFVKKPAK